MHDGRATHTLHVSLRQPHKTSPNRRDFILRCACLPAAMSRAAVPGTEDSSSPSSTAQPRSDVARSMTTGCPPCPQAATSAAGTAASARGGSPDSVAAVSGRPLVPTGEVALKCELESPVLQRSASSTRTFTDSRSRDLPEGDAEETGGPQWQALQLQSAPCVVLVANFAHLRSLRKKLGSREELLVMADAKPSDFNRMLGMGLKLHYREKERQVRPAPLLPTPPLGLPPDLDVSLSKGCA